MGCKNAQQETYAGKKWRAWLRGYVLLMLGLQTVIAQQPAAPSEFDESNIPRAIPVDPTARALPWNPPPSVTEPSPNLAPAVAAPVAPTAAIKPTWETQKLAENYTFAIPAPRGQITDRHGAPLAQTRVGYNLGIAFPTPADMSQAEASNYVNRQVQVAERLLGRPLGVNVELALKHYKNRPVVPFVIAQDLKSAELAQIRGVRPAGFVLQPLYLRYYPNETIAGHLIGFVGRRGRFLTGPLEDNEPLWPPNEGRDGLEQAFDEQLSGKPGVLQVSFDAQGRRSAERVSTPPTPGSNVVTTIDLRLQRAVESSLAKAGRPCAMVITDPNNGDVLAMASYPTVNPNWYVPTMPGSFYKTLDDDPKKPLIARAFRSSYPPGSTFKVFVGLAVMNAEIIDPDDRFGCPAVMEIGNLKFRNHRRSDSGSLNFAEALTQSCNTYFYKIGLKAGYRPIVDLCQRLGLGARTGIPIQAEEDGRLMTTEYMLKRYNRPVAPGDIANLSIGQGDTLVTPLQMALAMGAVGNGGINYAPRVALQVQSIDDRLLFGYDVRARDQIEILKPVMKAMREGMTGVVYSGSGTAPAAKVPGVKMAGKTGTAQWGPEKRERVAAWFAGFAPVDKPKYAFAAVYEGVPGNNDVHGGTDGAPIIGRAMREIFAWEQAQEKASQKKEKGKKATNAASDEDQDEPAPRRRRVPRAVPVED